MYQALSANSAINSVQQQGGSADGGEIFDKKVLTLTFSEPFALQKVCTTSFIKILQGKVYCKADGGLARTGHFQIQVEFRSVD